MYREGFYGEYEHGKWPGTVLSDIASHLANPSNSVNNQSYAASHNGLGNYSTVQSVANNEENDDKT